MAEGTTSRHYYVTEALFGEQPMWRVVRGETNARGVEVRAFVCGCATRRGALAMARAMSGYRDCDETPVEVRERAGAGRAVAAAPSDPARGIIPNC
ncbi:MAG: hypothetical protein CMM31_10285 [Rhodospirillaceae bacterium]|nr:hypothetical protein [Rhodospirillaceae bacterium]